MGAINVPEENIMKLYEGEIGKTYIVYSVMVKDVIARRLEALGVNEMTLCLTALMTVRSIMYRN